MGKYKTYGKYKLSGVDWLGEVPEHWEIRKLKFAAPSSSEKLTGKPEELTYVGLENVESKTGRLLLESPTEDIDSIVSVFRPGDVLFGKLRPYLAKVFYSDFLGVCTSELMVLRPVNEVIDGKYLAYLLLSDSFIGLVDSTTYGAKMPRANPNEILNIQICRPSLDEQKQIARFLDRETTRIDTLITKKRQLIALLQKKRDAIIDKAVTKGIDSSANLKDSGVSWIRQIPATWKLVRIKYLCKVISKGTTPTTIGSTFISNGIRFIKAENIVNGKVVDEPESFIGIDTHNLLKRSILEKLDVLMVIAGATIGKVGIVQENILPANTNQAVAFIRLNMPENLSSFLFYWLCSSRLQEQIWLQAVQAAQPNLSLNSIGNFLIPYPSLREASAIVEYLDRSIKKFDLLISKVEKSIEQLLKLRSSLITAAVTGKIDVREEVN